MLAALEARLAKLESDELARSLEWAEVAEKLQRYLKRISAVDARAEAREGKGTTTTDPRIAAVLRAKFPQSNGG